MQIYELVILDRDGVINEDSDNYIKAEYEWQALPGSLEAIADLNKAGYKVAIATNQSGISRKLFSVQTLTDIHKKMLSELSDKGGFIDKILYCPHRTKDNCTCRKPSPKMLLTIMKSLNISNEKTLFIGDSIKDTKAANNAKCSAALVKTGKGTKTIEKHSSELVDIPIFENLFEAVHKGILNE